MESQWEGMPDAERHAALIAFATPELDRVYEKLQGCGYALANAGHDTRAIQDWLGHRSIQHTVRYTELSPTRFRDFWR